MLQDLKKYHYYYWFAFPALKEVTDVTHTKPVQTLAERFTEQQVSLWGFHASPDK